MVTLTGTGTSYVLTIAPATLTFADQMVGTSSASQTVMVSNTGTAAVTISSIAASGDFAQSNTCPVSPATLASGANCTISVQFAPSTAGIRRGAVTLTDDADLSPQVVSLSGNGVAPIVKLTPSSLSFGNQPVNVTSASMTSSLMNTGTAPLTISSILATGEFAQTNDCPVSPATLAVGAGCTITATFTPASAGARHGAVTFTDDAGASPQVLSLSGTGTAPAVTLNPASLSFSPQGVGTTSAAQMATLTNSGNAPLTISSIVSTGDFAQTNDCPISPATLAASASCTLTVTFTPAAIDIRRGGVTITDNAGGSPHVIGLSGTGITAYSLSATSNTVTVVRGTDTATFTISAATTSGFTGMIDLSCSGNSPTACAFSPASIAPGQSSTLTVSNISAVPTSFVVFTVAGLSGSQTATVGLTIQITDFAMSSNPTSNTVSAGQSATYTMAIAPNNGFSGSVALSCSGAPPSANCSVSPASVTVTNGASPASATVTVTTTAPSSAITRLPFQFPPLDHPMPIAIWLGILAFMAAAAALARRRRTSLGLALTLAFVLVWSACGGGPASTVTTRNLGTPAGTYSLTITGTSGSLTKSINVSLTVR
jgi:Abnormal spindle-like microcephaly-assoc'd, ASPM-SPD-2-Hydin/HYDIN/CFA65/VesB-like, Ig-like domain/Cep192 domain 4